MYNALKLIPAAALGLLLAISAGCSDNSKNREMEARQLLDRAQQLVGSHSYDSAIVVLDTLDKKYRDCLDVRREGTSVRLHALSDLTRDSLASAELHLKATETELNELAPLFQKVNLEGTEGYYVDKNVFTGKEMNSTCVQMRIDDEGYCFIIVNSTGRNIGLTSIRFEDVTTAPGQAVNMEGSELLSISQEVASPLVEALWNTTAPANIQLVGTKGTSTVKLDAKQLAAFRNTWTYGRALQRKQRLNISLEKLERQLAKLNDQLANQIPAE